MPIRFNHMELTLPPGSLDEGGIRDDIRAFYGEVFGFRAQDVYIVKQNGLLLSTDDETSQFILLTQMEKHMSSPGYDHLGFLCENFEEVDAIRAKCEKWQQKDDRVQIKYYDDLTPTDTLRIRAFYVKYLLPIYFDVQANQYANDAARPPREWTYA